MKSLFGKIGSSIHKNPFKLLFLFILIMVAMIVGATRIEMATGNETLVQSDDPVYIATEKMESTFGGDSVLVLIESSDEKNLLTVENMKQLYTIEQQLGYEDDIFSIMSPAAIVHQISDKQKDLLIENVVSMSDGLLTMGDSLSDIGLNLQSLDLVDPRAMLEQLDQLNGLTEKFNQLSTGQQQMTNGLGSLETNLKQTSTGLAGLSDQLRQMASSMPEQQAAPLLAVSEQLKQTSSGLASMSTNTQPMQEAASNTSDALDTISANLADTLSGIKDSFSTSLSPDQLNEMAAGFLTMGDQLKQLSAGLDTIADRSAMLEATVVSTQSELDQILYDEDGHLKTVFDDVVLSPHQMMMVVKMDGNLDDQRKDELTSTISDVLGDAEFEEAEVIVSGKSVLDLSLKAEMKSSMMMMVALAVLIMFLVLALIFRVKWRMLSLGVIFVSVIATLGFMGWVSVPVTMVSMAVFPILIGLGIDYSIQFHNRFEEEGDIETTSRHIGKAVFVAVVATMLGFISLLSSPVPMIQDFGKMLTIGVFISFLGSLFLLLPTLRAAQFVQSKGKTIRHQPKTDSQSFMHRALAKGARVTIKFRYLILIVFLAVAGFGVYVDSKISVETNIETFMPQDLPALDDIRDVRGVIESTDQIVVYFEDENVLTEQNYRYMRDKADELLAENADQISDVKSISQLVSSGANSEALDIDEQLEFISDLPDSQRGMFISSDDRKAIIILQIRPLTTQALEALIMDVNDVFSDADMTVSLTGKSMLDVEMVGGLTEGRVRMTLIGIVLVLAALLLLYRHPIKALLPIIPVMMIIGISSAIMYALDVDWTPITATLGALVLGMGTEMTIMMMERYLEDRQNGKSKIDAIQQSVAKIGKAILASGLTTIGGFSVLLFSSFAILQDFGLMTMVNISLALISTFVVLPPLLYIFDGLLVKNQTQQQKD
ncbi:MAG: hydrophobe/amphiphile efflux-3 (HAE3) family transporter [Eubacteriales bacterium]|nr:hydrophobe/amphiphile efflux-3 (HAE3) family transporter [Eubacteriales bacterium]